MRGMYGTQCVSFMDLKTSLKCIYVLICILDLLQKLQALSPHGPNPTFLLHRLISISDQPIQSHTWSLVQICSSPVYIISWNSSSLTQIMLVREISPSSPSSPLKSVQDSDPNLHHLSIWSCEDRVLAFMFIYLFMFWPLTSDLCP